MSSSSYASQISVGDEVYGSDGEKVGAVAEVESGYIVIEKGFFFPPITTSPPVPSPAQVTARSTSMWLRTRRSIAAGIRCPMSCRRE
jgi:hypothetical protein